LTFERLRDMRQADAIRRYAEATYIDPAREAGMAIVTIVAGPIGEAMGLDNRMPAVCGALGTLKFRQECRLELMSRTGPGQGTTETFTFKLL
jgi:hypothetical protein